MFSRVSRCSSGSEFGALGSWARGPVGPWARGPVGPVSRWFLSSGFGCSELVGPWARGPVQSVVPQLRIWLLRLVGPWTRGPKVRIFFSLAAPGLNLKECIPLVSNI